MAGRGVWAQADETARKKKPISAVSVLMALSPFKHAQRIWATELLSWACEWTPLARACSYASPIPARKLQFNMTNAVSVGIVLKRQMLAIQDVYVQVTRRQILDPRKAETLVESILDKGQETPILVRPDSNRFVLVEGLHRLEACKALEET